MRPEEHELSLRDAVLGGDQAAWRSLYDGAYRVLWAYVVWRCAGMRELAEEITQETWLVAVRRIADFNPKQASFLTWLRGIAAKVILAWRRHEKRAAVLCDEQMLEHLDRRSEAVHQLAGDTWDEKLAGLRGCLEDLPDRYREPIRLRYLEELLPEALAQRLGLELETIKKRLQRGRARLWECLERKLKLAEATV